MAASSPARERSINNRSRQILGARSLVAGAPAEGGMVIEASGLSCGIQHVRRPLVCILATMNRRPARTAAYCATLALVAFTASLTVEREPKPAVLIHPQRWPKIPPALGPDQALEAQVEDLLDAHDARTESRSAHSGRHRQHYSGRCASHSLGSILNGGNSSPRDDKLAAPSEWLALADRFYEASAGRPGSARADAVGDRCGPRA